MHKQAFDLFVILYYHFVICNKIGQRFCTTFTLIHACRMIRAIITDLNQRLKYQIHLFESCTYVHKFQTCSEKFIPSRSIPLKDKGNNFDIACHYGI